MSVGGVLIVWWERKGEKRTHDTESTNDDIGRRLLRCNHLRDEVCGHSDDADEADGLHSAHDGKCRPESAEVGRHFRGLWKWDGFDNGWS